MFIKKGGRVIINTKFKSILTIFLPGIIIFLLELNAYKSGSKNLIVITPLFINPIILVVQGVITALTKTNIFLSLVVSSLIVLICIFEFMNGTALRFLTVYAVIELIAYIITFFIRKYN